jgi:TolA-binding protein
LCISTNRRSKNLTQSLTESKNEVEKIAELVNNIVICFDLPLSLPLSENPDIFDIEFITKSSITYANSRQQEINSLKDVISQLSSHLASLDSEHKMFIQKFNQQEENYFNLQQENMQFKNQVQLQVINIPIIADHVTGIYNKQLPVVKNGAE